MTEEQIREEIHNWLHDLWLTIEESYTKQEVDAEISKLLSIKGIHIEAENQELPRAIGRNVILVNEVTAYKLAQQDMLKEGWVKCLKKEERG